MKFEILNIIRGQSTFILVICTIIAIAYITPMILYDRPFGTDSYTHIHQSMSMYESNSLYDFYEISSKKVLHPEYEYNPFNYPFGLWLFGSTVAKVTGVNPYEAAYLLQIIFLVLIVLAFYLYASIFIKSKKYIMLSIIFLLSMPFVSENILRYRPSAFVIPFVLLALYFAINRKTSVKHIVLINILLFCLCFTHTGTYLFFLSFSIAYLTLYSLLWGKFQKSMYLLIASMLFIYVVSMILFPHIHYQYLSKSTILLSVGNFISSTFNIHFAGELSRIFYEKIFVDKSFSYALILSGFIFAISRFFIFIHSNVYKSTIHKYINRGTAITFPVIGEVKNVSHSVLFTPFWIGPIHTILSLVGAFKINTKGKCVFLAAISVTILPGALHTGDTGALRDIYYLLIIIPVVSSIGFYYMLSKIERRLQSRIWKVLTGMILLGIFMGLIITPIIGNVYYLPIISGPDYIVEGMKWLGGIGSSDEGCVGYGYRQVGVYTDKIVSSYGITHGTETRYFTQNLYNVFFTQNSEDYVKDLYATFNVKYLISSDKIAYNLGETPEKLRIDLNKGLDKLYSNRDFGIYTHFEQTHQMIDKANVSIGMNFGEEIVNIQDVGSDYLIETDQYKVRISKKSPKINYLGDTSRNLLGGGYFRDHIRLQWRGGPYKERHYSYFLQDLANSSVTVHSNQVVYKTSLKDRTEKLATLIVKYTFYQKVIKKEIIVSNDFVTFNETSNMRILIYTDQFSPQSRFTYQNQDETPIERTIYPSEDSVSIDSKFDKIYFNDGQRGIYLVYEKTAPYPDEIIYEGSTIYHYSFKSIVSRMLIQPSASVHITQYISVGDKENARSNIYQYRAVSKYPYPNAEIPLILISYIEKDGEFNYTLNTYEKLRNSGVSAYTEGLCIGNETNTSLMNQLFENKISVMKCASVYSYMSYDNLTVQESKIQGMIDNLSSDGFIPKWLNYNLNTIKLLSDKNFLFTPIISVTAPTREIYNEGLRHPQTAYYSGNKTELVLLPISQPTSSYLRPELSIEDIILSWKFTIDSVTDNDDMCILLLESEKIGRQEYIGEVIDVINYARNKGLSITTPHRIAKHYRLIQNIYATVLIDVDSAVISVKNENNESVEGVTFKLKMPQIDEKCPYAAKNGSVARIIKKGETCDCYVIADISAKETKNMILEPSITRKRLNVEIPKDAIEGGITIKAKDENEILVKDAIISIEGVKYRTDENGTISINLRKGEYKIELKKPGFVTSDHELTVKPRVYILEKIPPQSYLILGFCIILILMINFLLKRKRNKIKKIK